MKNSCENWSIKHCVKSGVNEWLKCMIAVCIMAFAAAGTAKAQAPSIGTIVRAVQSITPSNPTAIVDMLNNAGYTYRFCSEESDFYGNSSTVYVYSKNCKVIHEESLSGVEYVPSRETASSSIAVIRARGTKVMSIDVQIYTNSGFKTWTSQLKSLGYKMTPESGAGNRGQDWIYAAKGKPRVSIWNDYSNTYILSINL